MEKNISRMISNAVQTINMINSKDMKSFVHIVHANYDTFTTQNANRDNLEVLHQMGSKT